MEQALHELPLALFTTFAPIASGAFIVLVLAGLTAGLSDEKLKKLDTFGWAALGLLVIAFICAFFHLTQPFNAINVFTKIGSSPMSNEILAGVLFSVAAFAYCLLGTLGKLSKGLRTILGIIVAILALAFTVFIGLAYMIDTIPSWNSPWVVVGVIGCAFIGGSIFGMLLLAFADAFEEARQSSFKMGVMVLAIVGAVLAIAGVVGQMLGAQAMSNYMVDGAALAAEMMGVVIVAAIGFAIAAVSAFLALGKSKPTAILGIAFIIVVAAVFAARLAFYALQISVGL